MYLVENEACAGWWPLFWALPCPLQYVLQPQVQNLGSFSLWWQGVSSSCRLLPPLTLIPHSAVRGRLRLERNGIFCCFPRLVGFWSVLRLRTSSHRQALLPFTALLWGGNAEPWVLQGDVGLLEVYNFQVKEIELCCLKYRTFIYKVVFSSQVT